MVKVSCASALSEVAPKVRARKGRTEEPQSEVKVLEGGIVYMHHGRVQIVFALTRAIAYPCAFELSRLGGGARGRRGAKMLMGGIWRDRRRMNWLSEFGREISQNQSSATVVTGPRPVRSLLQRSGGKLGDHHPIKDHTT